MMAKKIYLETNTGKGTVQQSFLDTPAGQGRALQVARLYLRGGALHVVVKDAQGKLLFEGSTEGGEPRQGKADDFPSQASGYQDGLTFVGDVGDDIASFFRTVDRAVDETVFGTEEGRTVLGALPYGDLIVASHETRLELMGEESATARQNREAREREERERAERDARKLAESQEERRQQSAEAGRQARDLELLIAEAQDVTRRARIGDKEARLRLIVVKTLAGQGDPKARRLWKVYTLIADEDQMRIEQGAQATA
jgi:hypothetical protein